MSNINKYSVKCKTKHNTTNNMKLHTKTIDTFCLVHAMFMDIISFTVVLLVSMQMLSMCECVCS